MLKNGILASAVEMTKMLYWWLVMKLLSLPKDRHEKETSLVK